MSAKSIYISPIIFIVLFLAFYLACEDNGANYENVSPNRPYSPLPDSGAQDQALDVQLVWRCSDPDGDPLTYDIFFGTGINPPEVATGQIDTIYNPGLLDTNTIYYWKIIARDQIFFTTGPIWSFTTGAD